MKISPEQMSELRAAITDPNQPLVGGKMPAWYDALSDDDRGDLMFQITGQPGKCLKHRAYEGHFRTDTESSGIQWVTDMRTGERLGPYEISSQNNAGDALEQLMEIEYMRQERDEE